MTTEKKDENMVWRFVAGIALWLPMALWTAYVGSVLWGWFAVPLGAPVIEIWQTAGAMLLVGYFTKESPDEDDRNTLSWTVAVGVLRPAMALFCGWVYLSLWGGP